MFRTKLLSRVLRCDDSHAIFKRGEKEDAKRVGMGFSPRWWISLASCYRLSWSRHEESVDVPRRCDNFGERIFGRKQLTFRIFALKKKLLFISSRMYEQDRYLMSYKSTSSSLIYKHLRAFQPSFEASVPRVSRRNFFSRCGAILRCSSQKASRLICVLKIKKLQSNILKWVIAA